MRGPPPTGVTDEVVAAVVEQGWGLRASSISYVPEGGGSYHWTLDAADGKRYFASLDDLDEKPWFGVTRSAVMAGLRRALTAAYTLHQRCGLDFVVAPLPGADGQPIRRVDERHAIAVYPHVDGISFPFGSHDDPTRRQAVLEMLIALHQATPEVAAGVSDIVPAFGDRAELDAFLADPSKPWDSGPFGERVRTLLAPVADTIREVVASWEALVVETSAADPPRRVFTHGEPNGANVMLGSAGFGLIDWDTAGLAAPERDLWFLPLGTEEEQRYREATGYTPDRRRLLLYELRWYLDDTASLVRMFRGPHGVTSDTERWLDAVPPTVSSAGEWARVMRTAF